MDKQAVLADIERALRVVFRDRLKGVVLYGSMARGEAASDSDIDILALLEGPVDLGRDLEKCVEAVLPLSLEWERPVNVQPTDVRDFEEGKFPLYRAAKAEGLRR